MSDAKTPDPAVPDRAPEVADPVVPVAEPAVPVAEPVATPAEPVVPVAPAATTAAPVVPVVEKKKRGLGIFSFILGLMTILGDTGYVVFLLVAVFGVIGSIAAGDASFGNAIVVAVLFPIVYFGGYIVAGLGALLGLIALITGRGRVLGFFGLFFCGLGLLVRVLIATGAINLAGQVPGFGG